MSDNPTPRIPNGLIARMTRRAKGYFTRNGFELQRFGFFVAFPIAVYWVFSDPDRVERMYQWMKPYSTQPAPTLEVLPEDLMQRYLQGEEVEDILRDTVKKEEAKKQRQRAQLEELREQQQRYKELSATQSVSNSKAL